MKKMVRNSVFTLLTLVLAFACCLLLTQKTNATVDDKLYLELTSDEDKLELIGEDGKSDYSIVFSSDSMQLDYSLSQKIKSLFDENGVKNVPLNPDIYVGIQSSFEILIGNTNRPESEAFYEELLLEAESSDDHVFGYTVIGDKVLYLANDEIAFNLGQEVFLSFLAENELSLDRDTCFIKVITEEEYQEYLDGLAEIERQKRLEELLAVQAQFTPEQFGVDEYRPMIGENGYYQKNPYKDPWVYPVFGEHPRLFLNASDLDTVRALLEDPEYEELANNFWELANDDINLGVLEDTRHPSGKIYRYNYHYNHCMVAKALAYQITGDELYALEAIISIKNSMLTYLMIPEVDSDTYAGASNILYALSFVYDWCHDALTEDDKTQIIAGVPYLLFPQLEFTYPPTNMSYINGHGTGPQFLRDFMMMANAFADECPDWWDLILGRYFEQYFPVGNATYGKGWVSQGTANYAYNKLSTMLKSTLSIYTATGEIFFDSEANDSAYFLISHTIPRTGLFFQTGDGGRTPNGAARSWEFGPYLLAAALYKDPTMFAYAKDHSDNFSIYRSTSITAPSPAHILALISIYLRDGEDTGEDPFENIETIQYFDFPAGQMTARDKWNDDDAAAVLMKIGNLTMANHDCNDYGTFQIYYKGMLTCASGSYKKYGGNTHQYYLQATVSANGLLIFNPAMSSDDPSRPSSYFYSGGQRTNSGLNSLEALLGGSFTMGTTVGASIGYTDDGKAEYGYIAGDITNAYSEKTVDHVGRRMLTVYTGNAEFPMLFFTYDTITSVDPSFEKTYLLHTVKEPSIDEEALTATIVEGEGKMHVHSLFGATEMEKIGGPGKAYWVNGKNCVDEYNDDDSADLIWGRIEYRASGEKTTNMLTAMYVTDADNENTLKVEKFDSDAAHVARIGSTVAVFTKSAELVYSKFEFTLDGKGLYRYYITGVESGTWNVSVDGVNVASAYSSSGEGFISFVAPAGAVTVTPGKDVIGANGGKIQYSTGGAVLPQDAPYHYRDGEITVLPTVLVKDSSTFLGWYTTPEFLPETKVETVPEGIKGTFKVYAKWQNVYINEDFKDDAFYASEKNATFGRISMDGNAKPGSVYEFKQDESGVSYFHWTKGTKDSSFGVNGGGDGIHTSNADDKCISYSLSFGRDADKPVAKTTVRLIADTDVSGSKLSSTTKIAVLNINNDGVITCGSTPVGKIEVGKITTVRFVVDFEKLEIRVHGEDYSYLTTMSFKIPSAHGADDGAEFMKCFQRRLLHVYGPTDNEYPDSTLRVYGIRIEDCDTLTPNIPKIENHIIYNLGGGELPDDAPESFSKTESVKLPIPEKDNSVFLGWYTTPTYDESSKIEEIPPTDADEFSVYAKWISLIYEENYTSTEVNVTEKNGNFNGTGYNASAKAGASFITKTDEDGVKYLEWTNGSQDPAIAIRGNVMNLTNTTASEISFTFKFAKEPGKEMPNLEVNFVAGINVSGDKLSPTAKITVFKTEDGKVLLAGKSEIGTVTEEVTTVRFVVDFVKLEMRGYNENGEVIATEAFSIPASTGAKTGQELMKCFNSRILNIRGVTAEDERVFRLYGFKITEGDEFAVKA